MRNAPGLASSLPLPSLPELWDNARRMHARVETLVANMSAAARGWRLSFGERRDVRDWLKPVEQVVRLLIVGEALIRFLMHGKIPKRPPPAPPTKRSTLIPHPGWHTIARLWRREPDPPPAPPPPPPRPPGHGSFRVLCWRLPRCQPLPRYGGRPQVIDILGPAPSRPATETIAPPQSAVDTGEPCSLGERLARIIANPEPAIRRVASYFAKHLDAPTEVRGARFLRTRSWPQGDLWFDQALAQCRKAIALWERLIEPG